MKALTGIYYQIKSYLYFLIEITSNQVYSLAYGIKIYDRTSSLETYDADWSRQIINLWVSLLCRFGTSFDIRPVSG